MRSVLRWVAVVGGLVLALVVVCAAAVYGLSELRLKKSYDVALQPLPIPADEESIERGRHVATIRGCVDCHAASLGGQVFIDVAPLGTLYATNLTGGRGGVGSTYRPEDWDRAIRHGVAPDGRALLFMPSQEFYFLGDEDLAALVAYIESLPPVDNEMPRSRVGPLGRVLYLKGDLPLTPASLIDHSGRRPEAPPPGVTPEYGRYLAVGCTGCHGERFSGGKIPGTPPLDEAG